MVNVSDIVDIVNSSIGDDSEDRITNQDRINSISEATSWIQEELGNDHQKKVHTLSYSNIKHQYRLDDNIADVVNAADIRLDVEESAGNFVFKSGSDVLQDIGQGNGENSYGIERYDGKSYLVINYPASVPSETIQNLDSTDDWEVDDDATNLRTDSKEVKSSGNSLMFDIDVSLSVQDKATIKSTASLSPADLTPYEDLGTFFLWVYIPDATDITSVDLVFGTDSSNYWLDSATETTNGEAFSDRWNLVQFEWKDATAVGSPDPENVSYYEMSINYNNTQVDDTGFRFDGLQITLTKKMYFHYTSYNVGVDNDGNDIIHFENLNDVPFFSGQYDNYKYPVADKAASILFANLRLYEESNRYNGKAMQALRRYRDMFPSHKKHETGSFKVSGLNFRK